MRANASRRLQTAFGLVVAAGCTAATYLAAERLVAPWLHARLDMFEHAYFVRDIDHRLPRNHPALPTNEDGIRSLRPSRAFRESGTNLVFLGDSFTFGWGLPIQQSFPFKVERRLRARFPALDVKVANFGWVSASPLLSYRLLREIGHEYHPDLVVLCVDMGDFHDDLVYERYFEKADVYAKLSRFPIAVSVLHRFAPGTYKTLLDRWTGMPVPHRPYFVSDRPLEETRPLTEQLMRNVNRIHEQARTLGAGFVVFVLPRHYQYNPAEAPNNWERDEYDPDGPYKLEPFRLFRERAEEVDYPIFSLLETFQQSDVFPTCFDDDPHWNDAGTTLAANAISALLIDLVASRERAAGAPRRGAGRRVD